MWRMRQFKILFPSLALAALITVGGRSLAQMRQLDQSDREERRLERKVEALKEDYDKLQLNIERRLTAIETKMSMGVWMLSALSGVIGLHLVTLIGRGARDWVNERRAAAAKNGGP